MSWRDDKVEELMSRSGYLIEMDARDPELSESDGTPGTDRGMTAIVSAWEQKTTLVVEVGIDQQGDGFVIASAFDADGEPIEPEVLDAGSSVYIHATSNKEEGKS